MIQAAQNDPETVTLVQKLKHGSGRDAFHEDLTPREIVKELLTVRWKRCNYWTRCFAKIQLRQSIK